MPLWWSPRAVASRFGHARTAGPSSSPAWSTVGRMARNIVRSLPRGAAAGRGRSAMCRTSLPL
eukprot:12513095-Alexandrium_andersonii.AAC.1